MYPGVNLHKDRVLEDTGSSTLYGERTVHLFNNKWKVIGGVQVDRSPRGLGELKNTSEVMLRTNHFINQ